MTEQQPHTPTVSTYRLALRSWMRHHGLADEKLHIALGEFDRMIQAVEAAAEQRGAIKALRDAAEDLFYDGDTDRPLPGHSELLDRADQMEGDDA